MANELAPDTTPDLPSGDLLVQTLKESILEVFSTMLIPISEALGEHALVAEGAEPGEGLYAVSVDFEGCGSGSVVLRCTDEGAMDIARALLMLEEGIGLEEAEIYDALAECANLVTGMLKTKILDPVAEFSMGVPRTKGPMPAGRENHVGTLAYRLSTGKISAEVWLA